LNNLEREVAQVMEAIGLSFDDFDFIVYSFQFSGMNRVVTVIQNSITVVFKGFSKLADCWVFDSPGQGTPFIQSLPGPGAGPVAPEVFEFILEDKHRIDDFVQLKQFFQMLPLFGSVDIPSVFKQKILGSFKDCFVGSGSFSVFAVTHFIYDPVKLADHMEEVEDDLDMRDQTLDSQDIGVPHVHDHRFQFLPLFLTHTQKESPQGSGFSVFSYPDHTSSLVIQNHCQVAVTFADRDFVYSQDTKTLIIGLPICFFQELLVDRLDCFPVQPQMAGDLLNGQDSAKLEYIPGQSPGHPQVRVEELQLLDRNLLTVGTDNLPVMAVNPDPSWPEVQVSDPATLLAVNHGDRTSAEVTDRTKPSVGHSLQVSPPAIAGYLLPENTDSTKRKIMCYT
jgi:hypothetical protein